MRVLYADATILRRFALPRAGWGYKAPRARLPTRLLSQSHLQRAARRTRQAWGQERAGSRLTSGVWLSVIGAVPEGDASSCPSAAQTPR
jgi:hypothetical protein